MKKGRRRWLWFGLSAIVLGLIVIHISRSPEARNFRWDQFWSSLVHARPSYLLAAVAATYLTYLVRALRWKFFLDPIKKASLRVLFAGQVLGFSSIYLIGRLGELVRPAYIAKKEKVSFASQLAVWLLERIYDSVSLVLLFTASLYFIPIEPKTAHAKRVLADMHWGGPVMFVVSALIIAAMVVFRLRAEKLTAGVLSVFGFLPPRGRYHLEHFLRSFAKGLEVIQNWRDFSASIVVTIVLWFLNVSVLWLVFRGLGGGLERLPWLADALVLFFAAQGLVFQFPVIGGGYQVGALLALTGIFGVRVEPAAGAAMLAWILISVPCLALGVILLVVEGLTFKKLEAIAEEERATAVEKA